MKKRRVFIGLPSYAGFKCSPFNYTLRQTIRLLQSNGYKITVGTCIGNPYIQAARNTLVKEFRESGCNVFLFFDDDMSWNPADALRLLEAEGDIVGGVYPMDDLPTFFCKIPSDKYGFPIVRQDGCILAAGIPTGFMKINGQVFDILSKCYPRLAYGDSHDFFPQGVRNGVWVGEDYAFCDLWRSIGGKLWILPDVDFIHHKKNGNYSGNYHRFLMSLPGGKNHKG
jgi:hypothetical protein